VPSQHDGQPAHDTVPPLSPGEQSCPEERPLHDQEPATGEAEAEKFPFLDPPQQPGELGWLVHYRVVKLLGQGGMGLVFLAEDPRLQRPVALKVMRADLAQHQTARQRFLREARATAAIRSDHIVAIHEIGLVKDLPYLATEFLQGKPLDAYLEEEPRLTLAEVIELGLQIARGLEAAHRVSLIHRDIKPANIWVEETTRRIKILDFGLARLVAGDEGLTQCGTILGTPAYMAPEQADGKPVDPRCDLFSLGCVLYEVVAGKKPFEGSSAVSVLKATALNEPTPLQELAPALPTALSDLVMQLLAKDPENRPVSAVAVGEALEAIANTEFPGAPTRGSRTKLPAAAGRRATPGRRPRVARRAVLAGLLGVVLVVLTVFSSLCSSGPNANPPQDSPTGAGTKTSRQRSATAQG